MVEAKEVAARVEEAKVGEVREAAGKGEEDMVVAREVEATVAVKALAVLVKVVVEVKVVVAMEGAVMEGAVMEEVVMAAAVMVAVAKEEVVMVDTWEAVACCGCHNQRSRCQERMR